MEQTEIKVVKSFILNGTRDLSKSFYFQGLQMRVKWQGENQEYLKEVGHKGPPLLYGNIFPHQIPILKIKNC